MKKFGWSRVAILQEAEEVFISTVEDLERRCSEAGKLLLIDFQQFTMVHLLITYYEKYFKKTVLNKMEYMEFLVKVDELNTIFFGTAFCLFFYSPYIQIGFRIFRIIFESNLQFSFPRPSTVTGW